MWEKKGLIFNIEKFRQESHNSNASIPFAVKIESNRFKIFYSSRNINGKSLPYYIGASIQNGTITILGKPVGPILNLGELGSFDDSGVMPSSFVKTEDALFMNYIGYEILQISSSRFIIKRYTRPFFRIGPSQENIFGTGTDKLEIKEFAIPGYPVKRTCIGVGKVNSLFQDHTEELIKVLFG